MTTTDTRPVWATDECATTNDDGSGLWFERPVGRGYYVPGVGHEPDTMLELDEPMTFVVTYADGNEARGTGAPDAYVRQDDGQGMAFRDADAMRRYARVLLEVADDVERVTGGAL